MCAFDGGDQAGRPLLHPWPIGAEICPRIEGDVLAEDIEWAWRYANRVMPDQIFGYALCSAADEGDGR